MTNNSDKKRIHFILHRVYTNTNKVIIIVEIALLVGTVNLVVISVFNQDRFLYYSDKIRIHFILKCMSWMIKIKITILIIL